MSDILRCPDSGLCGSPSHEVDTRAWLLCLTNRLGKSYLSDVPSAKVIPLAIVEEDSLEDAKRQSGEVVPGFAMRSTATGYFTADAEGGQPDGTVVLQAVKWPEDILRRRRHQTMMVEAETGQHRVIEADMDGEYQRGNVMVMPVRIYAVTTMTLADGSVIKVGDLQLLGSGYVPSTSFETFREWATS